MKKVSLIIQCSMSWVLSPACIFLLVFYLRIYLFIFVHCVCALIATRVGALIAFSAAYFFAFEKQNFVLQTGFLFQRLRILFRLLCRLLLRRAEINVEF